MKTAVYISLFLAAMLLFPAGAISQVQTKLSVYNGQVNIKQNKAEVTDGLLSLDMDILLSGLSVGRYQSLELTPVLRSGNRSLRMPSIRINGANKQKMYERTIAFEGKQVADGNAYIVLKCAPTLLQEIKYKNEFSFQPWMDEAELVLVGELSNYEGLPVQTYTNVLTDHLHIAH